MTMLSKYSTSFSYGRSQLLLLWKSYIVHAFSELDSASTTVASSGLYVTGKNSSRPREALKMNKDVQGTSRSRGRTAWKLGCPPVSRRWTNLPPFKRTATVGRLISSISGVNSLTCSSGWSFGLYPQRLHQCHTHDSGRMTWWNWPFFISKGHPARGSFHCILLCWNGDHVGLFHYRCPQLLYITHIPAPSNSCNL